MSHVGSYFRTLLHGFSAFWRQQFQDRDVLETLQRGSDILQAESFREALEYAQASALRDASPYMLKSWLPVDVTARQLRTVDLRGTSVAFLPLGYKPVRIQYLQDRVLSPELIWEERRHFELWEDVQYGWGVAFYEDPLVALPHLVQTRAVAPALLVSGLDARVNHGTPDAHLPVTTAARRAAIAARALEQRTLRVGGTLLTSLQARAYDGRDDQLAFDVDELPTLVVGAYVDVGAPFSVTRRITRALSGGALVLDAPISGFASGTSDPADFVEIRVHRSDIFDARDVGLTVELQIPSGSYKVCATRTITEVVDALTVRLDRGFHVKELNAALVVAATLDATLGELTYLTADARLSPRDAGSWIYVVDSAGTEGFVEVEGVHDLNTDGFGTRVTFSNPDNLVFVDGAADTSAYPKRLDLANLQWQVRSPAQDRVVTFWAPEIVTHSSKISKMYGVLVGRTDEEATEAYKALVMGIFSYYQRGPTRNVLLSVLNVIAGLPVAQADGEVYLRTEAVSDGTVIITDRGRYLLPAGAVRDDLLRANPRSIVFRAGEPFSKAFDVLDEVTDPLWYRGVRLPEQMVPGATDGERSIDTELRALRFDGSWSFGDPGVWIGGDPTQPFTTVDSDAAHIDGADLYAQDDVFWPQDVGKSIYVNNRPVNVASFVNRRQVTLNQDFTGVFESTLRVLAEVVGSAITIEETPQQGFYFSPGDEGRTFFFEAGARLIRARQRLTARTMLFDELNGSPLAEALAPTFLWRSSSFSLIRSEPHYYSKAFIAARSLAGGNMFGVRYDLQLVAGSVTTIQRDLRDIVLEGKLSHTNMLDLPGVGFEDFIGVYDDAAVVLSVGVPTIPGIGGGQVEAMLVQSPLLTFSGLWNIGDMFQLSQGFLQWTTRISPDTCLPSQAAPLTADRTYPGVIDGRQSSTLWADLRGTNAGQIYEVFVYAWDGVSFTSTGASMIFDTDAPSPQSVSVPAALLYLEVVLGSPGTVAFALQAGVEAQYPFALSSQGAQPVFTGSIALTSDILTVVEEFYDMDTSRDLDLVYEPAPGSYVYEYVRIKEVTSSTTARLVYRDTDIPFEPRHTNAAVAVHFGPQRAWGQTAVTFGISQPLLTVSAPSGVASGAPFTLEHPLQLGLQD
jgi:hypothetical protein